MLRSQFVLMAMSGNGRVACFDPVRIQLLLFLIDREVADHLSGPHFDFRPDMNGPYDEAVFEELEALREAGQVNAHAPDDYPIYALTESGYKSGAESLVKVSAPARRDVARIAHWVLSHRLESLLRAICSRYPEMTINSCIPSPPAPPPHMQSQSPLRSLLSGVRRMPDPGAGLNRREVGDGDEQDIRAIYSDWRNSWRRPSQMHGRLWSPVRGHRWREKQKTLKSARNRTIPV